MNSEKQETKTNEIKSQKIHSCVSVRKTCRLTLFRKIIDGYSENHRKPINALYEQNSEFSTVTADGNYSKHCFLKGLYSSQTLRFQLSNHNVGGDMGLVPVLLQYSSRDSSKEL